MGKNDKGGSAGIRYDGGVSRQKKYHMIIMFAWKNIWRHKRRSMLNICTIAFSMAIIMFMFSIRDNGHKNVIESSIKMGVGHIQIYPKGYYESGDYSNLIKDPGTLVDLIKRSSNVSMVTERVIVPVIFSRPNSSAATGGYMIGVNPLLESRVNVFLQKIVGGRELSAQDDGSIIINENIAKYLKLNSGDRINATFVRSASSVENKDLLIKGVFRSNTSPYNMFNSFIPINDLKDILKTEGVHEIVVSLKDEDMLKSTVNELNAALRGNNVEIFTYKESLGSLFEALKIDSAGSLIYIIIILLIAGGGLINEAFINAIERTREIAVLKAIGTTDIRIFMMFFFETLILASLGIFAGIFLGILVTQYFIWRPIYIPSLETAFGEYGMKPYLSTILTKGTILFSVMFVLAVAVFCAIFPALMAKNAAVIEGLKE
jgi:putative ABC transport system permease protein